MFSCIYFLTVGFIQSMYVRLKELRIIYLRWHSVTPGLCFFFFFYFLFYFIFSSRARLSVDQGLSNRQTYKLLNVFLPGWFSRAVLRFNSSQAVNVFASWKKSEFFVFWGARFGWLVLCKLLWICAFSFLISRYNVSSN